MAREEILKMLIAERNKLDAAIKVLGEGHDLPSPLKRTLAVGKTAKPKRKISAAARRKMSLAAKARWRARKAEAKKA